MFPVLSRMAMDIISVQATSVAFEFAFSTSGRVLSIRRTRLTPASLEMCMCLKDHLDAQERKQHQSSLEEEIAQDVASSKGTIYTHPRIEVSQSALYAGSDQKGAIHYTISGTPEPLMRIRMRELRLHGIATRIGYSSEDEMRKERWKTRLGSNHSLSVNRMDKERKVWSSEVTARTTFSQGVKLLVLVRRLIHRLAKYGGYKLFGGTGHSKEACCSEDTRCLMGIRCSVGKDCKLYDAFDKFTHIKGESLHQYYLKFTQLINDMNIYKMKMKQFQVNTKFLNSLPPEWSKFVTDVKLVKDLHTTNFDQLHAYLGQHELHLRNSSNPRQQATIHDGRVTIQPLQGRQNFYADGEGHMARQCPKPKRKRDATWFKNKVLLVEAQGKGKVLNKEELEFLADLGIAEGPVTQSILTHKAACQADDLDAYDSDCDEISTAKAVLMANLSSYSSDVFSEVPYSDNTHNDMLSQSVQEMSYSEQTHLVNYLDNEITSDSNIIPYSRYLLETQNAAVHDTNSYAQQDAMILSVFEQLLN
nr:zinc finger BED domain-containing protein RICESLEEPER 3 [Tanacetum cinerariifolium]